ncbi:hypothetical protein [Thiobacillus denitrificans]|uniref:hypothetical protein n=1 Tax=Thiobacillus denitrificans TaxID=36861 RepID=UPI0016509EEA|nr:hypothetical protein [Thiobacillus denitrificans]
MLDAMRVSVHAPRNRRQSPARAASRKTVRRIDKAATYDYRAASENAVLQQ